MSINSCGTTMLNQGTYSDIGSITWNTTAKTSNFTATSKSGFFVNTTSGAITVTLPSSPSAGDIVGIKDYANTADTNNITIARNGSNIKGQALDAIIDTEGGSVILVYVDGTQGWRPTISAQSDDLSSPQYVTATGGSVATSGDFKIHTFTGPGTFCVSNAGNPSGSTTVDYLVTAGGASGGGSYGGGGGAGGFRVSFCAPASALPVSVQGYPITVGGGGAAVSPPGTTGNNGNNSVFSSITSAGGGGGAPADGSDGDPGNAGGSGGGGATSGGTTGPGGAGNTPPVSPSQGNPGGNGTSDNATFRAGGGGGGASAPGGNGVGSPVFDGGSGGNGTANSITGSSVTRAGGGGGGSNGPARAPGGSGGGGAGGFPGGTSGVAGTANTGGGGGSTHFCSGSSGAGGSGVVIIRYKFQN